MAKPRPRPGILEITPYVGGKASADSARRTIKLSANESAIGPSPKAIEAIGEAMKDSHRYPDGSSSDLRQAIGQRFGLDPDRVVCGSGSDEIIQLLCIAFAGPGDEVIYSEHGFLMYQLNALSSGATPIAAEESGLRTDVEALLRKVTSRTKLMFIANPNNPTGSYITGDELHRLHADLPEDVLLVIDAAYADYVHVADYTAGRDLAEQADNVVMTRTFSKLYGLGALRLGWAYGSPHIIDILQRVRGPFNVNSLAQAAGIAALQDRDHEQRSIHHNDHWLPRLTQAIKGLGLKVHPSVANFLLIEFEQEGPKSAAAASAWLEKDGVVIRPVGAYGLPHCLRFSIGTEDENMAVLASLERFMQA